MSNRDQLITVRVTSEEKTAIEEAAEKAGRNVSAHIRHEAADVSSGGGVPAVNRSAWAKLAPVASNLNQIARALNTHGANVDGARKARDVAHAAGRVVQALRRDLVGAQTLTSAAAKLDGWRRVANTQRTEHNADELDALAEKLRAISMEADELDELAAKLRAVNDEVT